MPPPACDAAAAPTMRARLSVELVSHMPFSVSAAAIGLVLAGMVCILAPQLDATQADHDHGAHRLAGGLFHLFHPVHMFFSAAATTAMFWRYERRMFKAVLIGMAGAIGVCGLSDIGMPYLSQVLLVKAQALTAIRPLAIHVCIIEEPGLVLPFAAIGVAVGLLAAVTVERSTLFSHSLHVFSSTMASIFYLIGPFGQTAWIASLGWAFLLVVLAVMVPCCLSDIVFPLAMARPARLRLEQEGHHLH